MESKDGVRAASQQWISAQRSPHRTSSRVGHQRVTLAGTFPMAPLRTDRDRFRINQLSSGLFREPRTGVRAATAFRISRTSQLQTLQPPVPLPPVHGSPVRPGGAWLPRVLLALRDLGTRVLQAIPCSVTAKRPRTT